jgi:SAM-dependent methyltransferase
LPTDLQNKLWEITLDGHLHLAQIDPILKVLDIGTGTGIWAINFSMNCTLWENRLLILQNEGDTYPAAEVIGTDLSPIQLEFCPPNVQFQVDDAEDEWTFSKTFNFVHGRMLFTCFKDPRKVIKMAFNSMDLGGYLELQDAVLPF